MTLGEGTAKPDFRNGFPMGDLPDGGMVQGQADGEDVILAHRGSDFFAIGAHCTHYHGPLAEGLIVGEEVRCPWHHACFSLRTGEALRAPALTATTCWRVERRDGHIFVREKMPQTRHRRPATPRPAAAPPSRMVILGGGAAGFAAA